MANCNHSLVSMPFSICFFFLFFVPLFMFFILNAPNKAKEDSILSEHFSIFPFQMLFFFFIVLSAILGVYCG